LSDLVHLLRPAFETITEADRGSLSYDVDRVQGVVHEFDIRHAGVTDGRLYIQRRPNVLRSVRRLRREAS
jgi:hypothetical protein